jgi:hypothetical protein
MSKRDHEREISRRALIKWSLAAGAALGVSRTRVLEVLERTAGPRTAAAAAAMPNKRSVHIRAGTGGLAWFQLMWPHNDVAAAHDTAKAWPFAPGVTQRISGTDKTLTVGPQTPWVSLDAAHQVTAIMAGTNEQHTNIPKSIAQSVNSGSLFAISSVLQNDSPSVVPVITVGELDFGSAPGAPEPSKVPGADDIVGLFNSAASRSNQLLATSAHADLYRAQYATLAALNRASNLSTTRVPYHTARSAAKFLGTNLASSLQYRGATDDALYGMNLAEYTAISNTPGELRKDQVTAFGRTLAVAAKAFDMGLTSSVILPSLRDDPHGAFAGGGALTADALNVVTTMKRMLDGFMADLAARNLADDVVITIEGDTPKDPNINQTWPDATPNMSNWIYILGGGKLRSGWYGNIDRNGNVAGFDLATGADNTSPKADLQAQAAVAATAYAITRGDIRRVQDFSRVEISGLIRT